MPKEGQFFEKVGDERLREATACSLMMEESREMSNE
jgi:hypothetical protein